MYITKDQLKKIQLITVLEDVQDQLLTELQSEFKHKLKFMLRDTQKHTKKLIRDFDRMFEGKTGEDFGEMADLIRDVLDKVIQVEGEDLIKIPNVKQSTRPTCTEANRGVALQQ